MTLPTHPTHTACMYMYAGCTDLDHDIEDAWNEASIDYGLDLVWLAGCNVGNGPGCLLHAGN